MNLSNPYIAGNPVGGTPKFIGRADVLREVLRVLHYPSQNAIVLFGQRRIGKTSVLQQLAEQLPDAGPFHSIYFDLQDKAAWPLARVLTEIAHRIADVLHLPAPDLEDEPALAFRKVWLPTILKDLSASEKSPSSLVLLFDEFDVLADPKGGQAGAALFPYLRDLMALNPARLQFIFVIGRKIEDLESIALSLFKATPSLRVSLLDHEDTLQLARLSEQNETLQWSPEALEKVWELTHGHPFLTQQLCSRVWENLYDEDPSSAPAVTPEDVGHATNKTLEASRNTMEWIWDGLPPAERIVISALAKMGNDPITQEQLEQTLRESGVRVVIRELQNAPQLLQDWDLLDAVDGGFQFRVELLRRWILKHKPLNRVQEELDHIEPAAENLFKAAREVYENRQLDQAESFLRQAIVLNPNHVRANQLLAEILIALDKTPESIKVLEHLFLFRPDLAKSKLVDTLSIKVESEKDPNVKLDLYEQILQIDPNNQFAILAKREIWRFRGNEALTDDNLLEAKLAFTHAHLFDKVKGIDQEILKRAIKAQLYEIEKLEYEEKFEEILGNLSNLEDLINDNFPDIPDAEDLLNSLQKKSEAVYLIILDRYEEKKQFEDALILIKKLSVDYPNAKNWDEYLSHIIQLSKIESLYQEALNSVDLGNRVLAMKQLANVIQLEPSYEDAARLLYITVLSDKEGDLIKSNNLKRLTKYNPFNSIILLFWILVTPHKLNLYRHLYGDKKDLVEPQAVLTSSLTWFPFLYPIIGIYLNIFPNIYGGTKYYLLAGIILVLVLWTVYISILRGFKLEDLSTWGVVTYFLFEMIIIGGIFAFLVGGISPGNLTVSVILLFLYFSAQIIAEVIYGSINLKIPFWAFRKLIGPIIGISIPVASLLTLDIEDNAIFSVTFLISFVLLATIFSLYLFIASVEAERLTIFIVGIIFIGALLSLPFWIAFIGTKISLHIQIFWSLIKAFYGNLLISIFISTLIGFLFTLLEGILIHDFVVHFNKGQNILLGRGMLIFILFSHALLIWLIFLGGWRFL